MQKEYLILTPLNLKIGNESDGTIQLRDRLDGNFAIESFVTTFQPYTIINGVNNYLPITTYGNVTLTPGIYDGTSLATMLSTAISAVLSGGVTMAVTYSGVTNKLTFTTSDSSSVQFAFRTSNSASTCHRILGFSYADVTVTSGSSSTKPIDLQPLDFLYVYFLQESQKIEGYSVTASMYIPWCSRQGKMTKEIEYKT
ncbi:hypothetical protein RFI_39871 [Reticulomyxa filosa]|uniref:Uncharacterized protein n=1 Tax=Reticulomyxa filosa TaxID=46433 RepID=X6L8B8_RETFI|nr:hypothetical protein RFI_39871 [Reticulomyxa filosa]|eukprot:ETN97663.1 hypothetical protein RFI_39871 [Reticulomyxa filosa]